MRPLAREALLACLGLGLACVLAPAAAQGAASVEELIARGDAFLKRGLAVAATDHERVEAYKRLGLAHFGRGKRDLEPAAEAFRQVLALSDAPEAGTHYSLAVVLRELGRPAEALEHARQAVAAWPISRIGDLARIEICDLRASVAAPQTAGPADDVSDVRPGTPGMTEPVILRRGERPRLPFGSTQIVAPWWCAASSTRRAAW